MGAQAFQVAEAGWLAKWSRSYNKAVVGNTSIKSFGFGLNTFYSTSETHQHSIAYWLSIYAALTTSTVLFGALRYLILYDGAIKASRKLHANMLRSIFRAPLTLFDRTVRLYLTLVVFLSHHSIHRH